MWWISIIVDQIESWWQWAPFSSPSVRFAPDQNHQSEVVLSHTGTWGLFVSWLACGKAPVVNEHLRICSQNVVLSVLQVPDVFSLVSSVGFLYSLAAVLQLVSKLQWYLHRAVKVDENYEDRVIFNTNDLMPKVLIKLNSGSNLLVIQYYNACLLSLLFYVQAIPTNTFYWLELLYRGALF